LLNILKAKLELRRLAEDWRLWAARIAKAAKQILGPCEAYVFGSVVEKHATGASDVDILVICDRLPRDGKSRGNLKAKIEEEADLPLWHPFEIHLADRSEASWYFRHIKRIVRIE